MCPSDIFEMPIDQTPVFGPEAEVFLAEEMNPCSIKLKDLFENSDIRIQVKTDLGEWKDYEQGELIIGRSVKCRMMAQNVAVSNNVRIEVFHT